jgi:hypothetical protein
MTEVLVSPMTLFIYTLRVYLVKKALTRLGSLCEDNMLDEVMTSPATLRQSTTNRDLFAYLSGRSNHTIEYSSKLDELQGESL